MACEICLWIKLIPHFALLVNCHRHSLHFYNKMKHSHIHVGSGAGPQTVNIFFFRSANPSHVFEEHVCVCMCVCVCVCMRVCVCVGGGSQRVRCLPGGSIREWWQLAEGRWPQTTPRLTRGSVGKTWVDLGWASLAPTHWTIGRAMPPEWCHVGNIMHVILYASNWAGLRGRWWWSILLFF